MYLNSFIYYVLFGSAVLIYGIGFSEEIKLSNSVKGIIAKAIKTIICVLLTVFFSYLLIEKLLLNLGLAELYPILSLMIYLCISVFAEVILRLTTKKSCAEFAVSYLIVLLALSEGITLAGAIIVSLGCLASFFVLLPILYALMSRIKIAYPLDSNRQRVFLLLSLSIILIIIASWNISWLNPGVIQ